jgi:hypothetical protein
MSKIWVCYFFGLFEQFIELETHVYRLPCLVGYLFAGLSPFFWWSKRVKGKTLQQTLYFASQVFICWAWTLLAWMDCASAFYKFNSKPIQEKVGTSVVPAGLPYLDLHDKNCEEAIYACVYIYVCVCLFVCANFNIEWITCDWWFLRTQKPIGTPSFEKHWETIYI